MQHASVARLRCDPTDYARKQQEKKDRAKELKEQRSKGFVDDDHTFAPKVNPRARGGAPSSREEDERPSAMQKTPGDDLPIRPSKTLQATRKEILAPDEPRRKPHGTSNRPNNNEDHNGHGRDPAGDALDSLSRKFPKKTAAAREPEDADASYASPAPEHDSLYREVKRATGHGIEDIPIAKLNGGAASKGAKHSGPCLRNSSCACPQCSGMSAGSSGGTRPDPPVRRRESAARPPPPESNAYSSPTSTTSRSSYGGAQSEMENSLTLLKSKMSRRKARTAPSNQASLYDDAPPPREPASKSARLPSTNSVSAAPTATMRRASAQQQPEPAANARASMNHAPAARKPPPQQQQRLPRHQEDDDEQEYVRPPPPISSGADLPDEYADEVDEMAECDNCHRRFNVTSFAKHQKICERVFSGPRKVFDMAAKRLEGTEAEKLLKQAGGKKGKKNAPAANDEKPIRAKAADWKQQSNAFRDAMRANREIGQALKEGKPLPPMAPSAPDPSLIPCDYCGRRFNDKAADRHIAFCKEKALRSGGGPPPKKLAAAPAAKPSAAASKAPPRKR